MKPILSVFLVLVLLFPTLAQAQLKKIATHGGDVAIIFIHGFRSDSSSAFKSDSDNAYMYETLEKDSRRGGAGLSLSQADYFTLGYPATTCSGMKLPQVVQRLHNDLRNGGIYEEYEQIVFVAHSLGGLVAKRLLINLSETDYKKIAAIMTLGTPTDGSGYADVAKAVPFTGRCRLLEDLKTLRNNSYLHDTQERWAKILLRGDRHIARPAFFCGYETKGVWPVGIIIPEERIDQTCDERFAFDYNHMKMDGPASGSSEMGWIAYSLRDAINAHAQKSNLVANALDFFRPQLETYAWVYASGHSAEPLIVSNQTNALGKEIEATLSLPDTVTCIGGAPLTPETRSNTRAQMFREGTASYRLEADLMIQPPHAPEVCGPLPQTQYSEDSVNAQARLTLSAELAVQRSNGVLVIEVENMPRPTVSVSQGEEPYTPQVNLRRVTPGSSTYTGSYTFEALLSGTYQIRFTSDIYVNGTIGRDEEPRTQQIKGSVRFGID